MERCTIMDMYFRNFGRERLKRTLKEKAVSFVAALSLYKNVAVLNSAREPLRTSRPR